MPYIDLESGTVLNGPIVYLNDEDYAEYIDDTAPDPQVIIAAKYVGTLVAVPTTCSECGGTDKGHYLWCSHSSKFL